MLNRENKENKSKYLSNFAGICKMWSEGFNLPLTGSLA